MKRLYLSAFFLIIFAIPCAAQVKLECPTVRMLSPEGPVSFNEFLGFTADISGGNNSEFEYKWTVSYGTIENGQNTPYIAVSPNGIQSVTAKVEIKGLPQNCPNKFSATGFIAKPATCIGLENIQTAEKEILDHPAITALIKDKNLTAHFYIKADNSTSSKEIDLRISRILKLFAKNKIAKNRLIFFIEKDFPFSTSACIYVTNGEDTLCKNCQVVRGDMFTPSQTSKKSKSKPIRQAF